MEDLASPAPVATSDERAWSFPRRFVAVFTSPKALFEHLEHRPSFFVPLLVSLALIALFSVILWNPVILPEMLARFEEQGTPDSAVETMTRIGLPISLGSAFVFGSAFTFLIALIVQGIGGFLLGGKLSYKQALSIVCHTSLVSVPAMAVLIPLALVAKTAQVSVGPGMLFPSAQAEGFGAKFLSFFLSSIDVFRIWQLALTALGVSVIGRVSRNKALVALGACYLVASLLGAAIGAMSGR
jgi:hypothetical protein